MQLDYTGLINMNAELQARSGYLESKELQARNELAAKYEKAKRAFVYGLLKDGRSSSDAAADVGRDLDEITAHSDASWHPIYQDVRHDLLAQIDADAARKPWLRTLRHRAPWIVVGVLIAVYLGIRLYNSTPVEAPVMTRAGLEQRAAALHKTLRYNDWASTRSRRGGLFKGIFLWPIEPTDAEVKGAGELAGLALLGAAELVRTRQACGIDLSTQDQLSDAQSALLWSVAAHLRAPTTSWRNPVVMTVLDPIRSEHPCP